MQHIAETVGTGPNPPIICGLARATKQDIETCARAVQVDESAFPALGALPPPDHAHIAQGASFPRIHTFLATSDIHMKHKVRARLPSACLHGRWALLIRALARPAPQDAGGGPGDDGGDGRIRAVAD